MLASFEQHKIAQICTNSYVSKIKKELSNKSFDPSPTVAE